MSGTPFVEKLKRAMCAHESLLCVGLDPMPDLMPVADVLAFNRAVVEATADLVCAYKLNFAFYEALGLPGIEALLATVRLIPPAIPTIADAKRGDIGHSSAAYAHAVFDTFGFDACTVNPYIGADAVRPFLERPERAALVLCKTSNPGSGEFQDLACASPDGEPRPLYEIVADHARSWNDRSNVGLVVGATYPAQLARVRQICPELPILLPGVGTQAGDLPASVQAGLDSAGLGLIVNVSRQVIYADRGSDFARGVRRAALAVREAINRARG